MSISNPEAAREMAKLVWALAKLLRIPEGARMVEHPIYRALHYAQALSWEGITMWSDEQIKQLVVPAHVDVLEDGTQVHVPEKPLELHWQVQLQILLSFYHHLSRIEGKPIKIKKTSREAFSKYRIEEYEVGAPIVSWNTQTKRQSAATSTWLRQVKPSRSDYKEFRDETAWITCKTSTITTLESHGLQHLIDDKFDPSRDLELHKQQQTWLYKTFDDIFKTPTTRAIVITHVADKDCLRIWTEICNALDNSITTELHGTKMANFLAMTIMANCGWRGTQEAFIRYWQEKARQYNLTFPHETFSDVQLTRFLRQCVRSTPNLANVYNNHMAALKSAGNTGSISFAEYVELLVLNAQIHDATRT